MFEPLTCLDGSSQLEEKITANAREQVVSVHRPLRGKRIDQVEASLWSHGHGYRDCSGQLDHRRRRHLGEGLVEPGEECLVDVLGPEARAWQAAIAAWRA